MDIQFTLPLDGDGFLRRECPTCRREFKWHHGPANEEAERHAAPDSYHCPFCGNPADEWFTQEQSKYIEGVATSAAVRSMDDELGNIFRGMNSKHLKFKRTGHLDIPDQPMPLTEADDMTIIASPCHDYEPIKVPDTETGPFHCLVCGSGFAV